MILKVTSYIKARGGKKKGRMSSGKAGRRKSAKAIVREIAKATIRYMIHRPDREGERVTRDLFGPDGPMEKYHAYWMVDTADPQSVFFRIAFSPDAKTEDADRELDLWRMTGNAVQKLRESMGKDIQFVGVEHDDQTEIRHVNTLVIVPGRLTREEFRALPKILKAAAERDIRQQRKERDPQPQPLIEPYLQSGIRYADTEARFASAMDGTKPRMPLHTCPYCGPSRQRRSGREASGADFEAVPSVFR